MARRGGFPGGMPGNMTNLMKQQTDYECFPSSPGPDAVPDEDPD